MWMSDDAVLRGDETSPPLIACQVAPPIHDLRSLIDNSFEFEPRAPGIPQKFRGNFQELPAHAGIGIAQSVRGTHNPAVLFVFQFFRFSDS
jgi:hypothetical protein